MEVIAVGAACGCHQCGAGRFGSFADSGVPRVTGVWRDDTIALDAQEPVPWPPHTIREPLFAGSGPIDGWDFTEQSTDVDGLQQLRDTGQIVRDRWLRTDNGSLILRVAVNDVDMVEAVLAPQLPRRRYVVATPPLPASPPTSLLGPTRFQTTYSR